MNERGTTHYMEWHDKINIGNLKGEIINTVAIFTTSILVLYRLKYTHILTTILDIHESEISSG